MTELYHMMDKMGNVMQRSRYVKKLIVDKFRGIRAFLIAC